MIELQEKSKSKKGKLGKTCVSYIRKLKLFEDLDIQGHLSTGSGLTLPFLQADMGRRFGENHYNDQKLLSLIEFPESPNFQFAQDYKLRIIILGIIGTNGRFLCDYATCYKTRAEEVGNYIL